MKNLVNRKLNFRLAILLNKTTPKIFFKNYDIRKGQEVFKIHHILTDLPIPAYQIITLKNREDGIIKGIFYGNRLIKIHIKMNK